MKQRVAKETASPKNYLDWALLCYVLVTWIPFVSGLLEVQYALRT